MVKLNFGECHSLGLDENLISGFICALESFSNEITRSIIKSINFEDYIFHFYKDQRNLLHVFISEPDDDIEVINFKIRRIASLFVEMYSTILQEYNGEISRFNDFGNILIDMNLTQKNCGGRPECEGCPNSVKTLKVLDAFKEKKKGFLNRLKSLFNRKF